MESLIDISGLSLAFERDGRRTVVIEGFDLAIRRGEFLAIVGPSGVGKSTLLRVIADLARPTAGTVRVGEGGEAARVALVFQDARLLPWRRVIDNVAFGLERLGLSRSQRLARARSVLDIVGLGALAERWPHELSGGQRQRVSLARALAVDPDVLLMDEPFSALDAITRTTLQDEIVRIWRETGKTVLFVTHDIDEAIYLADRVVVLSGAPARVTAEHVVSQTRPRDRAGASLHGLTDRIRRDIAGETVSDGAAI